MLFDSPFNPKRKKRKEKKINLKKKFDPLVIREEKIGKGKGGRL